MRNEDICVSCGEVIPEGNQYCPSCYNTEKEALEARVHDLEEQVEDLETLVFAFVWNRGVAPIGKHLGKTEEEIADKVLETIREGEKKVCYPLMRKRMLEAKKRLAEREDTEDA